jgi:Tfp pilus assembly protein PilF
MKTYVLAASATVVLFSGCVSRSAAVSPGPITRRTASRLPAQLTLARQVQNAVEAGEGEWQVREWQRKLMRNPQDTDTRLRLADYFNEAGSPELAAEHYRIAGTQRPAEAEIALKLAATLQSRQLSQEALGVLETAASTPELAVNVRVWSQIGVLRDELGLFEKGEEAHRRAIGLEPENGVVHNNLGYHLLQRRRLAEAITSFRESLRLSPRSEVARGNLAAALAGLKESPEARQEALLHWKSMGGPAFAQNNLAAALIEQGDYEGARKALAEALRINPSMPEALGNLRTVAERDGGSPSLQLGKKPVFWSRPLALLRRIFFSAEPAAPVAARRLDR